MGPKDLHITFGECGKGTFVQSQAYELSEIELICLNDNLSIGPLHDIFDDEHINSRISWLRQIDAGESWNKYMSKVINNDINAIKHLLDNPESIDKIFLWTGNVSYEIISTARLLYNIAKLNKNIYKIDFPNIPIPRRLDGKIIYPDSLFIVDVEHVDELKKHFKEVGKKEMDEWCKLWVEILKENAFLRIIDINKKIIGKDVTYFDNILLSNCKDEFQKAARVIGTTLADIDFGVGDSYLNWRLKQLSLKSRVETRGILREIRDYEVKKFVAQNAD